MSPPGAEVSRPASNLEVKSDWLNTAHLTLPRLWTYTITRDSTSSACARQGSGSNGVRLIARCGITSDPKLCAINDHVRSDGHRLGLLKDPRTAVLHADLDVEERFTSCSLLDLVAGQNTADRAEGGHRGLAFAAPHLVTHHSAEHAARDRTQSGRLSLLLHRVDRFDNPATGAGNYLRRSVLHTSVRLCHGDALRRWLRVM